MDWDEKSDVWGIGCILFELFTGNVIFPTHSSFEHLAMIDYLFGPFPKKMIDNANPKKFSEILKADELKNLTFYRNYQDHELKYANKHKRAIKVTNYIKNPDSLNTLNEICKNTKEKKRIQKKSNNSHFTKTIMSKEQFTDKLKEFNTHIEIMNFIFLLPDKKDKYALYKKILKNYKPKKSPVIKPENIKDKERAKKLQISLNSLHSLDVSINIQ